MCCVIFVGLLTSVCGLCWRQTLVLLHTRVWRLWNGRRFENGPNYLRNTEHYHAAVDEFQRRLDRVIDVKGGRIEK